MANGIKLYLVTIRKGDEYYVIANEPSDAYNMVSGLLDRKDWFFPHDREMKSVTLLAEMSDYPGCGKILLMDQEQYKMGGKG